MECPIVGCQHLKSFSIRPSGFSNSFWTHLRRQSHSDCVDMSKVKVFGPIPKYGLVFDCEQNVLVCLPTQKVILNGEYDAHKSICQYCTSINTSNVLKDLLSTLNSSVPENDQPIEGLIRYKGIKCPACNSVMVPKTWGVHKCNKDNIVIPQDCSFQRTSTKNYKRLFGINPRPTKVHRIKSTCPPKREPAPQPNRIVPFFTNMKTPPNMNTSKNKKYASSLVLSEFQKRST